MPTLGGYRWLYKQLLKFLFKDIYGVLPECTPSYLSWAVTCDDLLLVTVLSLPSYSHVLAMGMANFSDTSSEAEPQIKDTDK